MFKLVKPRTCVRAVVLKLRFFPWGLNPISFGNAVFKSSVSQNKSWEPNRLLKKFMNVTQKLPSEHWRGSSTTSAVRGRFAGGCFSAGTRADAGRFSRGVRTGGYRRGNEPRVGRAGMGSDPARSFDAAIQFAGGTEDFEGKEYSICRSSLCRDISKRRWLSSDGFRRA